MTLSVLYSELARRDIRRIYRWYESRQTGLGLKFIEAIEKTENHILQTPAGFARKYKNTREVIILPFPYFMIYSFSKGTVFVHTIFPTRKKPSGKYKKIRK